MHMLLSDTLTERAVIADKLAAYIPSDRRQALAQGLDLPSHVHGTALVADICGFTPLTEVLARALGPRRGAEATVQQINQVYDALIAEVDLAGGSVLSFDGDSITCWFDDGGDGGHGLEVGSRVPTYERQPAAAALRAVACAMAMQAAMRAFAMLPLPGRITTTLALKVAIASGPARRFVVGDPAIQRLDILAGATLAQVAVSEHLAQKGEVLIDMATVATLADTIQIAEWREDTELDTLFAVVGSLNI
jgi:class 3 adenylate cyclase